LLSSFMFQHRDSASIARQKRWLKIDSHRNRES
jgi:hypothetical protein